MTSILKRLFDNRSSDEKNRDYELYTKRIFPFGEEQKGKVGDLLESMFPTEKRKYLLLHYILFKEELMQEEPMSYDEIATKINKKKLVRITPEFKATMKALTEIDMDIDEHLFFPTGEELREMAIKYLEGE